MMINQFERDDVWVIDDDKSIRWVLKKALEKANLEVTTFENGDKILNKLEQFQPKVIISDVRMPGIDGFELLKLVKVKYPNLPVIIMTAHSDLDSAISAYQRGAFEYLPKPFDIEEAVAQVKRACLISKESEAEEDIAKALHNHSNRKNETFIALNMAAIPKDLMESELFGHEKGAFTGAQTRRKGRFEQADKGTLFLDEIGDMPAELQTRLLRVLADGQFYPIGSHEAVKVDVRIVAATHQDLKVLVRNGDFREDLFHRLNVIRIQIPALRERLEDIPLLMEHFLQESAAELGVSSKRLLPETINELRNFDWPGNVRQLENTARWLTVMASGQDLHIEDLPIEIRGSELISHAVAEESWQSSLARWARDELDNDATEILNKALPSFETILINAALQHTAGKKQEAAKLLGWGRNTLTRKMKELDLNQQSNTFEYGE